MTNVGPDKTELHRLEQASISVIVYHLLGAYKELTGNTFTLRLEEGMHDLIEEVRR